MRALGAMEPGCALDVPVRRQAMRIDGRVKHEVYGASVLSALSKDGVGELWCLKGVIQSLLHRPPGQPVAITYPYFDGLESL